MLQAVTAKKMPMVNCAYEIDEKVDRTFLSNKKNEHVEYNSPHPKQEKLVRRFEQEQ